MRILRPQLINSIPFIDHIDCFVSQVEWNKAILFLGLLRNNSFMAELDDYDGLDKELFLPYINQQELFTAYQNALNLIMTKPAERAYLSVKLMQRTLSEHLYLPEGVTQSPALVLLHASSGIQDTDKDWAKLLQAQGYAVLLVDSFTARGYVDRKAIGWDKAYQAQLNDLPDAYLLMSQQKTVNPERVGLIGFSLGGYSVLRAMQHDETTKIPFKSAASFYGHAQRLNPGSQFGGQVALLQGDDDDRSPLSGAITLKHYTGLIILIYQSLWN